MIRRYAPWVIVVAVAAITVTSAILVYRAKRPSTVAIARSTIDSPEGAHIRGPADAPVTLDEFGDYQCPPCGHIAGPIKQLEQDFAPKLRVIFHHFPLTVHQHARTAACAAEAAGLQGRFWEMHDVLYREQAIWSKVQDAVPLFKSYAGMIGLDVDKFANDLQTEKVKERVEADQKQGASLGVQNTPTIFINNKVVDPKNLNPDGLRAAINAAVQNKSS